MMTYLDLVNAMILELGINGGKALTGIKAADNSKEALRIAGFIADADIRIQALYNDWKFMWRQYTDSINTGGVLSMPIFNVNQYKFRLLDRDSLWFYPGTTQAYQPRYMEWREYTKLYQFGNLVLNGNNPAFWSQAPNRVVYISNVPTQALPYSIEGYAMPYRMQSDGSVSPIVRFNASHTMNKILPSANEALAVVQAYQGPTAANERDYDGRIIVCRAKMIYAEVEGALEIMQGSMAEYEDCLKELQSTALPGQEDDWAAQSDLAQNIDPFL